MTPTPPIAAYDEAEQWQLAEIQAGLKDLETERTVSHERASNWLRSWGEPEERSAPK